MCFHCFIRSYSTLDLLTSISLFFILIKFLKNFTKRQTRYKRYFDEFSGSGLGIDADDNYSKIENSFEIKEDNLKKTTYTTQPSTSLAQESVLSKYTTSKTIFTTLSAVKTAILTPQPAALAHGLGLANQYRSTHKSLIGMSVTLCVIFILATSFMVWYVGTWGKRKKSLQVTSSINNPSLSSSCTSSSSSTSSISSNGSCINSSLYSNDTSNSTITSSAMPQTSCKVMRINEDTVIVEGDDMSPLCPLNCQFGPSNYLKYRHGEILKTLSNDCDNNNKAKFSPGYRGPFYPAIFKSRGFNDTPTCPMSDHNADRASSLPYIKPFSQKYEFQNGRRSPFDWQPGDSI